MVGTTLIGAALIAASYTGIRFTPERKLKRQLDRIFAECGIGIERDDGSFISAITKKVVRKKYGYRATVFLPTGYAASKFEKHIEVIEQATRAQIRVKRSGGQFLYVDFGMLALHENMQYKSDLVTIKEPVVPLFTPFGLHELNFWDDASCHLLIGGATRMGKSVLLRLIVTSIMARLDGRAQFFIIDNKIEDLFPFRRVNQIECAETISESLVLLLKAKQEVMRRRKLLKAAGDCVNMRQYREKHPEDAALPLFVIIDEYGRVADDDQIQECIIELAETSGSYDVHLIISSQRPDAATVLKPRIKANLLARIAFTTADEANSTVIIGSPNAATLGRIKGRALLLDSMLHTVQVPYVSEKQVFKVMERFKGQEGINTTDTPTNSTQQPNSGGLPPFAAKAIEQLGGDLEYAVEQPGQTDFEVPRSVPRFNTGADRGIGLWGLIDEQSSEDSESGDAAPGA